MADFFAEPPSPSFDDRFMRQAVADLRKEEPICSHCGARTELGMYDCTYARCPKWGGTA